MIINKNNKNIENISVILVKTFISSKLNAKNSFRETSNKASEKNFNLIAIILSISLFQSLYFSYSSYSYSYNLYNNNYS